MPWAGQSLGYVAVFGHRKPLLLYALSFGGLKRGNRCLMCLRWRKRKNEEEKTLSLRVRRQSSRRSMRTLDVLILFLVVIGLAGCEDRRVDVYLFGPAKSCFPTTDKSKCDNLMVYDKVEIKVRGDRQEVAYVQKGLRLDASNTIFRRLENCNIIDRNTFSCNGLVRTDGQFVDTKVFGNLVVSESYWTFAYSEYFDQYVKRDWVRFFHDNDLWITVAMTVVAVIVFLLS